MEPRLQGLDALRGVAVALVMLRHSWPNEFGGGGIVGVTVFFALSGYLITSVLLRDIDRGKIDYARFYRHRALRLLPALLLLLVVYAAVALIANPLGETTSLVIKSVAVGLLYLADLPVHVTVGLTHLWTLSVEEQFYLAWPTLLFVVLRRRIVGSVIAALFIGLLAATALILATHPGKTGAVYQLPTTWAPALLMGASARIWRRRLPARPSWIWVGTATILLVVFTFTPDAKSHPWLLWLSAPVIGGCSVVLILRVRHLPVARGPIRLLFGLGTISYAVYLWNLPMSRWIAGADGHLTTLGATMVIPATIAVATVSWYTAERAGRVVRARTDSRRPMPPR
jgi:peptidoglycan/LPS O-acetylase OafA/YrhL